MNPLRALGSLSRRATPGFTLLELLVVLAILAIATASVTLAMRDPDHQALQRDAERLAAHLESGRAWSRSSGQPLRWVAQTGGYQFLGRQPAQLPERWLNEAVSVEWPVSPGPKELVLGPEPILAAQGVTLRLREQSLRLATDGLQPFAVRQP